MPVERFVPAGEFFASDEPPPEWIVTNLIPRHARVMFWGHGGAYKTWAAIDVALSVTSGLDMLDRFPVVRPGRVALVSREGTPAALRHRFRKLAAARGLDPAALALFFQLVTPQLDQAGDQNLLLAHLKALKPEILVLDPLRKLWSGDENSPSEAVRVTGFLDRIIDEVGSTVIVVHHAAMGDDDDKRSFKKPRGTSAWHDWADTSVRFQSVGRPRKHVAVTLEKQRDGFDGGAEIATVRLEEDLAMGAAFWRHTDQQSTPMDSSEGQEIYGLLAARGPMTLANLRGVIRSSGLRIRRQLEKLVQSGLAASVAVDLGQAGPVTHKGVAYVALRGAGEA